MTDALSARRLPFVFGAVALVLHVVTARGYGWFRDELYYVACGEHLAFGYVDHPPFVALVARLVRLFPSDSPVPLRVVAAVVGALTVAITGSIAVRLGGGRFAAALASLCALVAPLFLSIDGFFSMNVFDLFFCALASLLAATILVEGATTTRFVWLGVVIGVGLENKLTIGFLAAGLVVGMVTSEARSMAKSRGPWIAMVIAIALFSPNLVWQAKTGFMTLEFMNHARLTKNAVLTPLAFLGEQALQMHPMTLPVWLAGLVALLASKKLRVARPLGVMYLVVLLAFMTQRGKAYYVGVAYAPLFAAGAVWIESVVASSIARVAGMVVLGLAGAATAPLVVTLLSPDAVVRYQRAIGKEPGNAERGESAALEQRFADQFGWDTLVLAVAEARDRLTPDERSRFGIFGRNYGEAAAVDVLGARHGLPHAMSGHNNYWLWGPKGDEHGPILVIGGRIEDHLERCGSVEPLAERTERFAMPNERHLVIFACRDPKSPLHAMWPSLRHFDLLLPAIVSAALSH
jgi:hypothetical protein